MVDTYVSIGEESLVTEQIQVTYYAIVNSASGVVTFPPNATLISDAFQDLEEAVCSTVISGKPTFNAAVDAYGDRVVTSLDQYGNYSLSPVPSAFPVALVYRVKQPIVDLDVNQAILEDVERVGSGAGVYYFGDSSSISMNESLGTVTSVLKLSSDAYDSGFRPVDLIIEGDGLRAQIADAYIGSSYVFNDTASVNLSESSGIVTADLKLSTDAYDSGYKPVQLILESDGIRAQISDAYFSGGGSSYTFNDTSSIDLTNISDVITADLKLSSDAYDAGFYPVELVVETNGLRAQISDAYFSGGASAADTMYADTIIGASAGVFPMYGSDAYHLSPSSLIQDPISQRIVTESNFQVTEKIYNTIWREVATIGSGLDFLSGCECDQNGNWIIIGNNGSQAKCSVSSDNGSTFSSFSNISGVTEYLWSIASDTAGTWVAVGNNGTIIYSTNNGASWSIASSGTTEHINHVIWSAVGSTFYAVGRGSYCSSSPDGITWTDMNLSSHAASKIINVVGYDTYNDYLIVGSSVGDVYYFNTGWSTWNTLAASLPLGEITAIFTDNLNLLSPAPQAYVAGIDAVTDMSGTAAPYGWDSGKMLPYYSASQRLWCFGTRLLNFGGNISGNFVIGSDQDLGPPTYPASLALINGNTAAIPSDSGQYRFHTRTGFSFTDNVCFTVTDDRKLVRLSFDNTQKSIIATSKIEAMGIATSALALGGAQLYYTSDQGYDGLALSNTTTLFPNEKIIVPQSYSEPSICASGNLGKGFGASSLGASLWSGGTYPALTAKSDFISTARPISSYADTKTVNFWSWDISVGDDYSATNGLGNIRPITLNDSPTQTFSNLPYNSYEWVELTLIITQGAYAPFTVTWDSSIKWPGGTAPTLSTNPGDVDIIKLLVSQSVVYGKLVGNAFS